MENFSIVKFLQSMLVPQAENAEEKAEKSEHETSAENPETPPVTEIVDNGQQAVLLFMEEHERRAKRLKNK